MLKYTQHFKIKWLCQIRTWNNCFFLQTWYMLRIDWIKMISFNLMNKRSSFEHDVLLPMKRYKIQNSTFCRAFQNNGIARDASFRSEMEAVERPHLATSCASACLLFGYFWKCQENTTFATSKVWLLHNIVHFEILLHCNNTKSFTKGR